MKRSTFIAYVAGVIDSLADKGSEYVADKILQALKARGVVKIDMTCDFCDEPCQNNWCESTHKGDLK